MESYAPEPESYQPASLGYRSSAFASTKAFLADLSTDVTHPAKMAMLAALIVCVHALMRDIAWVSYQPTLRYQDMTTLYSTLVGLVSGAFFLGVCVLSSQMQLMTKNIYVLASAYIAMFIVSRRVIDIMWRMGQRKEGEKGKEEERVLWSEMVDASLLFIVLIFAMRLIASKG